MNIHYSDMDVDSVVSTPKSAVQHYDTMASAESAFALEFRRQVQEEGKRVYSVRFDPDDNRYLAVGYSDGCIGIYRASNMEQTSVLAESGMTDERLPVSCLRWRPKPTLDKERLLISAGVDGNICYWNPLSSKLIAVIKPEKESSDLLCLDYTRDATWLAAAGKRRSIKVFDDVKRSLIMKLKHKGQSGTPGHSNRIFSVKFDETGKLLASASWDMTVKVWDLSSGTVIRNIFGPEVSGDALDLQGDTILTGSHRPKNALQMWDLSSGKLIREVEWDASRPSHSSRVLSAQFDRAERGLIIACGASKNEVRAFEKDKEGKFDFAFGVTNVPSICSTVDLAGKENLVAVGCCDGACRVFEIVRKDEHDADKKLNEFGLL